MFIGLRVVTGGRAGGCSPSTHLGRKCAIFEKNIFYFRQTCIFRQTPQSQIAPSVRLCSCLIVFCVKSNHMRWGSGCCILNPTHLGRKSTVGLGILHPHSSALYWAENVLFWGKMYPIFGQPCIEMSSFPSIGSWSPALMI